MCAEPVLLAPRLHISTARVCVICMVSAYHCSCIFLPCRPPQSPRGGVNELPRVVPIVRKVWQK